MVDPVDGEKNAMPDVYASLRSANFEAIDDELRRLEQAGIDGLHVDVMDGQFCEEISLPLEQVAAHALARNVDVTGLADSLLLVNPCAHRRCAVVAHGE